MTMKSFIESAQTLFKAQDKQRAGDTAITDGDQFDYLLNWQNGRENLYNESKEHSIYFLLLMAAIQGEL